MLRQCGNPACSSSLDGMRSDALFCSKPCGREANRLAEEDVPAGTDLQGFWPKFRLFRRSGTVMSATARRAARSVPLALLLVLVCATATAAAAPVRGPDISNNQGCGVNLHKIYKAGARFIGLKATEGTGFTDRCFAGYMGAARHEGLIPMPYDFAHLNTSPTVEADRYIASVKSAPGGFSHAIAVVDVEAHPGGSITANRAWVNTWINRVRAKGNPPLIAVYTAPFFWNPKLGCWKPAGAALWVATYGPRPAIPCGWSGFDFWQFTDGRYGPQPHTIGAGPMDISVFSGDYSRLLTLTGTIAEHPFASRTLHDGSTGTDVRQFQHAVDKRRNARGQHPIRTDGHYGAQTERAKHRAEYDLGFPHGTVKRHGASPRGQELIAHPGLRPVSYKARAKARK